MAAAIALSCPQLVLCKPGQFIAAEIPSAPIGPLGRDCVRVTARRKEADRARWLRFIRQMLGERVHFWPFDGWEIPPGRSAAEVYPALWSRSFAREGRKGDQHDENLAMHSTLVVVPHLTARLRKHGLDRQQEPHLLRIEYAALWTNERDALALETKPGFNSVAVR